MVTLVSCVLCMLWADPWVYGSSASPTPRSAPEPFGSWRPAPAISFSFRRASTSNWVEQQVNFDEKVAPRIHPNETYCVVGFGKYILAVAPKFHPELGPYKVFIAHGPQECGGLPILAPQ